MQAFTPSMQGHKAWLVHIEATDHRRAVSAFLQEQVFSLCLTVSGIPDLLAQDLE